MVESETSPARNRLASVRASGKHASPKAALKLPPYKPYSI